MSLLAALAIIPSAHAATVSMNADDASGTTSFNTAGHWNNLAAPSSGNDYVSAGFLLRTPATANGIHTFLGDSLTITGPGGQNVGNNDALLFKGTGASGLLTVNNLVVNGGELRNASGNADFFNLAGNLTVGSLGMVVHIQGPTFISSVLAGSGAIKILDPGSGDAVRTLHLTSSANTYNGSINLVTANRSRFSLDAGANMNFLVGASGINNNIFGAGVANFAGIFNIDVTGAGSTVGDTWNLVNTGSLAETYGATFGVAGFNNEGGGTWSKAANGGYYVFYQGTGNMEFLNVVPEPGSGALLLLGAGAFLKFRRSRRA
ncbi:MAG: PEP-CTERM sorting domain-containing protein [Verrucomicrobiota bacterium]